MNKNTLISVIAGALLVTSALFSGLVVVMGGFKFTIMLGAMIVGIVMMTFPVRWLLILLIGFVFLIYGPLMYFASVDTSWAPYLLGLELLFLSFFGRLAAGRVVSSSTSHPKKIPAHIWCFLIFLIIAAFSTFFGNPNPYTLLIGVRNILFLWGVYFVIPNKSIDQQFFRNLWSFFVLVAFVQIPMSIYQRFVVAAHRSSINDSVPWDAVIGTFFGVKDGGGDSGGMAFFLLSVMMIAISLWRFSQLSGFRTLIICILSLIPILLAEVKIVYILIPIMMILIFRSDLIHRPIVFFGGVIGACAIVISVFMIGEVFNTSLTRIQTSQTLEKKIDKIIGFSTKLDVFSPNGVEIGRMTSLAFWWEKNQDNPASIMIGNGIGSTGSDGKSEHGVAKRNFPTLHFGNSVASILLWDVGILGLFSFMGILFFSALRAGQLSKDVNIPNLHRAYLNAAFVIISSSAVFIPYSATLISNPTMQVIFFLNLSLVAFWDNKVGNLKRSSFEMKVSVN